MATSVAAINNVSMIVGGNSGIVAVEASRATVIL